MTAWRCKSCLRLRQIGDPGVLTSTLDPKYRQGRCKGCDRYSIFDQAKDTIPATKPDPELGAKLKEQGMARADDNAGDAWRSRFDAALRELAEKGEPFTSEDVTAKSGLPLTSGAVGARMNAAAKRGDIVWTGSIVTAKRANQHSASLRVWQGSWTMKGER